MLNLLALGYRDMDADIVWDVVVRDIPMLKSQLRSIVDGLDEAHCRRESLAVVWI